MSGDKVEVVSNVGQAHAGACFGYYLKGAPECGKCFVAVKCEEETKRIFAGKTTPASVKPVFSKPEEKPVAKVAPKVVKPAPVVEAPAPVEKPVAPVEKPVEKPAEEHVVQEEKMVQPVVEVQKDANLQGPAVEVCNRIKESMQTLVADSSFVGTKDAGNMFKVMFKKGTVIMQIVVCYPEVRIVGMSNKDAKQKVGLGVAYTEQEFLDMVAKLS
jgi:hypothetical protein